MKLIFHSSQVVHDSVTAPMCQLYQFLKIHRFHSILNKLVHKFFQNGCLQGLVNYQVLLVLYCNNCVVAFP